MYRGPGRTPTSATFFLWIGVAPPVDAQTVRDPLDRLQGEVALAALDSAHVGAMYTQLLRECLLADVARLSVGPKVLTQPPLQVAFGHACKMRQCYFLVYILMSSTMSQRTRSWRGGGPSGVATGPFWTTRGAVVLTGRAHGLGARRRSGVARCRGGLSRMARCPCLMDLKPYRLRQWHQRVGTQTLPTQRVSCSGTEARGVARCVHLGPRQVSGNRFLLRRRPPRCFLPWSRRVQLPRSPSRRSCMSCSPRRTGWQSRRSSLPWFLSSLSSARYWHASSVE